VAFITDCVSMFSSQAKECGVRIEISDHTDGEYCTVHGDLPPHSSLTEEDTVFMDKFKMDQVRSYVIVNPSNHYRQFILLTPCL
jgi:hypothetical protein